MSDASDQDAGRPLNFTIEHRGPGRYDWRYVSVHGERGATETEIALWQEIERGRGQLKHLLDLSQSANWPSRTGNEPMTEDEFFWIVNGYSRQITDLLAAHREAVAEGLRLREEVQVLRTLRIAAQNTPPDPPVQGSDEPLG